MGKEIISQKDMMNLLNSTYELVQKGIPGTKPCTQEAQEYLDKYKSPKKAAQKMIDAQVLKCTTSGFVTGLGGLLTLPVAIPANVASVIYVQMRMIAIMAALAGYDLDDDEVKTLVFVSLTGSTISETCKSVGIQVGNKVTLSLLKKLPGKILTTINQKVGFRLVTKFGTKGVVNLWKMVPVAGGVVGGAFDFVSTKTIADKAYQTFFYEMKAIETKDSMDAGNSMEYSMS